jgi:DNA-nicking Smr family endonuclease
MSNSKRPQGPKKAKAIDIVEEVSAQAPLLFCRPSMSAHAWRELRAGNIQPSAILDLHGLTFSEAEIALVNFLNTAYQQEWMMVKIIHGKGGQSTPSYPVLKNFVNRFLRMQPHVLAFTSTPPRFGGTGAVYVWLDHH